MTAPTTPHEGGSGAGSSARVASALGILREAQRKKPASAAACCLCESQV
jgi:hypothetical protein